MIEPMQNAIDKISELSEKEQKELANLIEQELKWQSMELKNDAKLEELANEAMKEFELGNTNEEEW